MALHPTGDLLVAIQSRVARVAVGVSSLRSYPPGTALAARAFLIKKAKLERFGTTNEQAFLAELDRVTQKLQSSLPTGARKWGLARKLLNIFLRDCAYNVYLRSGFNLGRVERHLEVPLDRVTAERIWKLHKARKLKIWPGVGELDRSLSDEYQAAATTIAKTKGLRRIHLDVFFWAKDRDR